MNMPTEEEIDTVHARIQALGTRQHTEAELVELIHTMEAQACALMEGQSEVLNSLRRRLEATEKLLAQVLRLQASEDGEEDD